MIELQTLEKDEQKSEAGVWVTWTPDGIPDDYDGELPELKIRSEAFPAYSRAIQKRIKRTAKTIEAQTKVVREAIAEHIWIDSRNLVHQGKKPETAAERSAALEAVPALQVFIIDEMNRVENFRREDVAADVAALKTVDQVAPGDQPGD